MSFDPNTHASSQQSSKPTQTSTTKKISDDDYSHLAAFRFALRKFMVFSEEAAQEAGLMPQQHQALLAIKYLSIKGLPSVGDIADRLLLRHHSVVELISRMARMGLVKRLRDPDDGRRVRVALTEHAEETLANLSATHLAELQAIRPLLIQLLQRFDEQPPEPRSG